MITKPTLLIDEKKCRANIELMFSKSQKHGLDFRPHFKTHQSLEIGRWFKELGVTKITVSSLEMAEYFASEWNDITVAFPVNVLEIERINTLAWRIQLNLLVDNETSIKMLSDVLSAKVNMFIEVNIGQNRSGVAPTDHTQIEKIIATIENSSFLTFKGFLAHAGHSYKCRRKEDVLKVHEDSLQLMKALKEIYISSYPNSIISLGDTPCFSIAESFDGLDEMRPGNFVFYDLTQNKIGSNHTSQIAVALACPIVSLNKERSEVTFYGGGVHLSKDRFKDDEGIIFGRVAQKKGNGWGEVVPNTYVNSLSQEHGTLSVPIADFNKYHIGDYLLVLPVHSCMTSNLMKSYLTLDGKHISRF
ncbi:MAG: alanine racemase [Flavobacteriales bacterium]|nr:alanine racemase [Flavobacteriales bacterium]